MVENEEVEQEPEEEPLPEEAAREPETEPKAPKKRKMPFWKKALVAFALLFVAAGVALQFYEGPAGDGSQTTAPAGTEVSPLTGGLVDSTQEPGGASQEAAASSNELKEYSPAFLKVGFSFLVGMGIGAFLRTFLRAGLVVVGLVALILFGLEYSGFVTIDWNSMGDSFNAWVSGLGQEFESFKTFVLGRLPATGSAATGLYAGMRRG